MTTPMPAFELEPAAVVGCRAMTPAEISSVIAMAWSDVVSFEMILAEWGLTERAVRDLMRHQLKSGSYRAWRQRVQGSSAKHSAKQTQQLKELI